MTEVCNCGAAPSLKCMEPAHRAVAAVADYPIWDDLAKFQTAQACNSLSYAEALAGERRVFEPVDEVVCPTDGTRIRARMSDAGFETRIEYGHQTADFGWLPEARGIKYASYQREVTYRNSTPVFLDHWSDPDGRRIPFTENSQQHQTTQEGGS